MAIQHILPTKVYTAYDLFATSEGMPFDHMPLKRWKRFVFQRERDDGKRPLHYSKGKSVNSAYKVTGEDFLDFALQY